MERCKENKFECNFCGKNFTCGKSLGGHIRIHKNEKLVRVAEKQQHKERSNILKIQVPKQIRRTNKRDSDYESGYELRDNPKLKHGVSDSRQYKSLFWLDFEEKRFEFDYQKQRSSNSCKRVEAAAISLIMMSRDLRFSEFEALHLVEESSDSNSDSSSDSECYRKKVCKKVKLKVSVNGPTQIDEKYKKNVKLGRSDIDHQMGASSSYKYEPRKKISSSGYSNDTEMVRSHHRNSHSGCEWTATELMEPRNGKNKSEQEIKSSPSPSPSPKKKHKCPICLKTFKSGQALGGHKRSHVVGSLENASILRRQESNNGVTGLIDLNVPAPMEDEEFGRWG